MPYNEILLHGSFFEGLVNRLLDNGTVVSIFKSLCDFRKERVDNTRVTKVNFNLFNYFNIQWECYPILNLTSIKTIGSSNLTCEFTCFSKTSSCTSGGEKFLLKSSPHSPMATHSAFWATSRSESIVESSHDFASCGWTPTNKKNVHRLNPGKQYLACDVCNTKTT